MPPRGGRWRGRGGSRGRGSQQRLLSRSDRANRTVIRVNAGNNNIDGIHAIYDNNGLLIIAGLQPEHFPEYDSQEEIDANSDSHSDFESEHVKATPRKTQRNALHNGDAASASGHDGDWTETDVEVWIAPKSRGFYRPPPKREVVRQKVRRNESSRYNARVKKVHRSVEENEPVDHDDNDPPSRRSSQKSGEQNEDLPTIVEQEATDDEGLIRDEKSAASKAFGRGKGRKRKSPTPEQPRAPPEIIDEGELSDSNFPPAYLPRQPVPPPKYCEDKADWIMRKRFKPMADPLDFVKALTKVDPATRSTEVLYAIALNAQKAIKVWQDEYLALDKITAPKANPPKKPLNGGRNLIDPAMWEDMLEADLYDYSYDSRKQPGEQDPFRQRAGGGKFVGGRELRQRRGRDVGAVDLSDGELEGEGYGTRGRRRAAQRQVDTSATSSNLLEVPAKRAVKRTISGTTASDVDGPRKRGRPARVHELREDSQMTGSSEQDGHSNGHGRRGRPPGSKNTMLRSDAGIKKGPRKPKISALEGSEDIADDATDAMDADQLEQATDGLADSALHTPIMLANGNAAGTSVERASESTETPTPAAEKDPKKKVRSEKRSKSMTEWWAARKAKAAEDRKLQLAQAAEADRIAEEQARAARQAHQSGLPPHDARNWPYIAPQHGPPPQARAYPGPPPPPPAPHVAFTGPQPSQDRSRAPPYANQPQPAANEIRPTVSRPSPITQRPPPLAALEQDLERIRAPFGPSRMPLFTPAPPAPPQHARHPSLGEARYEPPNHPPPPPIKTNPAPQLPPAALGQSDRYRPSLLSMSTASRPPPISLGPPTHRRPPSVSFAGSPPRHVFHHHPAPPPPPAALQISPPPPPPAPVPAAAPVSASQQGPLPPRQPSPLRRIINYVSDPTRAAQPTTGPYQSIMTPGAGSPNIIQHQPTLDNRRPASRPDSRGKSPPPSANSAATPSMNTSGGLPPGNLMGAFHVNNSATRSSIPGTGSFRPETPGKSTFTHYTMYTPPGQAQSQSRTQSALPQGRLTGAQVQDLALGAAQPAQRRPLADVLKEQQQTRDRAGSSSSRGGLMRLQPAPDLGAPRGLPVNERPREDLRPLLGGLPPPPPPPRLSFSSRPPSQSGPPPVGISRPPSQNGPASIAGIGRPPAHSPPFGLGGPSRPQLPGFANFWGAPKSISPPGGSLLGNRSRSISGGGGGLGQPLRLVPLGPPKDGTEKKSGS